MSRAARGPAGATPAIRVLAGAGIKHRIHEYEHDPNNRRYGTEAVQALGVPATRVFKTLVISVDGRLVNAVVPVSGQLDLKAIASACGGKKAQLTGIAETERRTGYMIGGVSPFGQRSSAPVVMDLSAQDFSTVYVSAGRRGLEIELRPDDLVMLTNAQVARIASLD